MIEAVSGRDLAELIAADADPERDDTAITEKIALWESRLAEATADFYEHRQITRGEWLEVR